MESRREMQSRTSVCITTQKQTTEILNRGFPLDDIVRGRGSDVQNSELAAGRFSYLKNVWPPILNSVRLSLFSESPAAVLLFLAAVTLVIQSSALRAAGRLGCASLLGGHQYLTQHRGDFLQAIVDILGLVTIPLAGNQQVAVLCQSVAKSRDKSLS